MRIGNRGKDGVWEKGESVEGRKKRQKVGKRGRLRIGDNFSRFDSILKKHKNIKHFLFTTKLGVSVPPLITTCTDCQHKNYQKTFLYSLVAFITFFVQLIRICETLQNKQI